MTEGVNEVALYSSPAAARRRRRPRRASARRTARSPRCPAHGSGRATGARWLLKFGANSNDHLSSAPPTPAASPGGLGKTPSARLSLGQGARRGAPLVVGEPVEHGGPEVRRRPGLGFGVHQRGVRLLHQVTPQPDERVDRREVVSARRPAGTGASRGVVEQVGDGDERRDQEGGDHGHDRDRPERAVHRLRAAPRLASPAVEPVDVLGGHQAQEQQGGADVHRQRDRTG